MSAGELKKSRVLIIDDEEMNIDLLENILRHENYILESTSDSSRALEIYQEFSPHLVLLDLKMPPPDGFELLEAFKALEKDSYVPVLVLTAFKDHNYRIRALKCGAHDFLNKPFNIAEVMFRIRNLLEVRHLHDQVRMHNELLELKVKQRTEELQRSYEQLRHSEKLAAVGKLAASISHEFNNPVLGIRSTLEQVSELEIPDKNLRELVDLAIEECSRVMRLALKLKQFFRPSDGVVAQVDLNEIIKDLILFNKKRFDEKGVCLELDLHEGLPGIQAIEDQIKQVVLNLFQNAEDALPAKNGRVKISTGHNEKKVVVTIEDNGCGILDSIRDRIFDPFFTTKDQVHGTGLGLSVSYGIVKKHGGDIAVESVPHESTRFSVTLPIEPVDPGEIESGVSRDASLRS